MELKRDIDCITQSDIQYFRERCPIGQELKCMTFRETDVTAHGILETPARCTVLHKGKHIAVTDIGSMQWALLTIWNKGKLREWQYMEQKVNEIRGGL